MPPPVKSYSLSPGEVVATQARWRDLYVVGGTVLGIIGLGAVEH